MPDKKTAGSAIGFKERQKMIKDYQNGMSVRDIAAKYGRSYGGVYGVLERAHVEMRNRGGGYGKQRPATS